MQKEPVLRAALRTLPCSVMKAAIEQFHPSVVTHPLIFCFQESSSWWPVSWSHTYMTIVSFETFFHQANLTRSSVIPLTSLTPPPNPLLPFFLYFVSFTPVYNFLRLSRFPLWPYFILCLTTTRSIFCYIYFFSALTEFPSLSSWRGKGQTQRAAETSCMYIRKFCQTSPPPTLNTKR